jgi:hypothetical protein
MVIAYRALTHFTAERQRNHRFEQALQPGPVYTLSLSLVVVHSVCIDESLSLEPRRSELLRHISCVETNLSQDIPKCQ